MSLHIIVLAAGQGTRMISNLPKVLHTVGGTPMLKRVIETAEQLNPSAIHVVVSPNSEAIQQALSDKTINWVIQDKQLGTGHAVMQALPFIEPLSQVLVLYADVPLIQPETLQSLVTMNSERSSLNLLLAYMENPTGLGRIVRNAKNNICAIVEEKDATQEQRHIKEVYTGVCSAFAHDLNRWLPALNQNNAQEEYYLTEIIAMAVAEQLPILSLLAENPIETQGVNNRLQLEQLERELQRRTANQLMLSGVTLADSSRVDVRGKLSCGKDVFIDVNNVFTGTVTIGDGCNIGPNCVLNNVTIGKDSTILPNSVLDDCLIGDQCQIGPFARLRPGTQLANRCKIGNFVETKNAVLDENSKANHLTYLGDTTIGKNVNIGAGTITCNYDGAFKHKTVIEDNVFIGSDTQLIAPITVGQNATIGAGSSIRKNVPPNELTLSEAKQKTIYGWNRPKKG